MSHDKHPAVTAQALLALRDEPDALARITALLRVREMGPADHLRTKHEVRELLVNGDLRVAENLIRAATQRVAVAHRVSQRLGQSISTRKEFRT
jgi:hypothetical protein